MIRADLTLVPDPATDPGEAASGPLRRAAETSGTAAKVPEKQAFPPLAAPTWARANGRAGDPLFAAGAGLALLDAFLRREPPAAGALRARLSLQSAAATAKILRLNADEGALRGLRCAATGEPPPAAKLLRLWRELAARPPALDAGRVAAAAAALDLSAPNADALAEPCANRAGQGIQFPPPQKRPPQPSPPSRTPQRPQPKSLPFGHSTSPSPCGCAGRGQCR